MYLLDKEKKKILLRCHALWILMFRRVISVAYIRTLRWIIELLQRIKNVTTEVIINVNHLR